MAGPDGRVRNHGLQGWGLTRRFEGVRAAAPSAARTPFGFLGEIDVESGSTSTSWKMVHCEPHIAWDETQLIDAASGDAGSQGSPRILLVGLSHDLELANLARRLSHTPATVRVLLLDRLSALPTWRSSSAPLDEFDVGYCRAYRSDRPVHYHFDQTLRQSESWGQVDNDVRRYAAEQVDTLFWALMARYRVAHWVNSPWNVRLAENKLTQLDVAESLGFVVPRTLVSSQRDEVRSFMSGLPNGVVSKSLDSPITNPGSEVTPFQYTSPVGPATVQDMGFPQLYQERVAHQEEFRVTVVGHQIFAAKVEANGTDGSADWRIATGNHAAFEATLLPDDVRARVSDMMTRLDLQVGGIDLLRTGDGIYFLEVNPSCAFLWLERSLEIEISNAVMRLLLSHSGNPVTRM